METYNISYVDLFGATLFRDHRNSESGVYSIRVYLIETDIVIRPVTIKRFKRIGLNYIK